jgi:MerR family mercuric resistance operon transcriptional regulator
MSTRALGRCSIRGSLIAAYAAHDDRLIGEAPYGGPDHSPPSDAHYQAVFPLLNLQPGHTLRPVGATGSRHFVVNKYVATRGVQRGELARRTGCNLETIRYYETIGLIPEPPRTAGGHRSYDTAFERRLRFILRARGLGFSLEKVRELLRLVDERHTPCAEARDLAAAHLEDVRVKIVDLKSMELALREMVAKCADGTRLECPLIEALFREK